MICSMSVMPPVSIIAPAYREAPNLESLITRVFAATRAAGIEAELIIVDDDSQDGTEAVVERLCAGFPVRLVVRRGERGLSSAVLRGFTEAKHDRFLVMDADLQHPPELIPQVLERLEADDGEIVIATRYRTGSGMDREWSWLRRLNSRVATWLARPLVAVSDPMSGFFALRREVWCRADRLNPVGYKIALELLVKGGCRRPAEVPFQFAARASGQSKLNLREQLRYLRHLGRLYRYRFAWPCAFAGLSAMLAVGALVWWMLTRASCHST